MTKLKTLKGLEQVSPSMFPMIDEERYVNIAELKQEAIKCGRDERTKHMSARDFILWFFNITEDDLK